MAMHENQLRVTVDVVRELVSHQFPEWALLSIAPIKSEGTVNAILRIGDGLAARFLLQPGDVGATRQWLRSEAKAALELLEHTSFAVPEPVAIGKPGGGYPLPWSVQTWIPGTTASQKDASTSDFAHDLGRFIEQVRAIDVRGRHFAGNGRGGRSAPTTSGWRSASSRASIYWMLPDYVELGHGYGRCRGSRPMS